MIHGFVIDDTIGFFSNTTTSIKGLEPIFRGVISEADLDKSKVDLLQVREGHEENDHGLYRAFQIGWALTPIKIKVQTKFTAQLSEKLKTELIEFIQSVQNVELVNYGPDIVVADTIINNETGIILKIGNGQIPLLKMSPIPIYSEYLKKYS